MNAIAYADRAEWLEKRRLGIGGSDAAAILGVSRFRTALDVWEDKVGVAEDRPATAAMEWGNRLEAVVADAVADRTGLRLRRVNRILVHPTLPFVLGNLDRVAGRDTIVEIKTARVGDGWATEEEAPSLDPVDRVPMDYYVQGQHYAAVTGRSRILFGVLVGGSDLRVIETPADPGFGDDLLDLEATFWRTYVESGVRPPLSWADADALPRLYPRGEGEKVATPEVDGYVEQLLAVRAREDDLERQRKELEVRIKDYLGDSSDLVSSVAKVSWRNSERSRTDWQQIAIGYRQALDRIRSSPTGYVGEIVEAILSDGFGTTDLDEVEGLFTEKTSVRTFRVDRKKGASK